MAGSTVVPWSIPYPTGTDRVADGDNAMQALAERQTVIDNALPRGLIATGFGSGGSPGAILVTLPSFTFAEARDVQFGVYYRGKNVTAGTGWSFVIQDNGTDVTSTIDIRPTSTFESDFTTILYGTALAAGAHVIRMRADAYGATNNTITVSRLTVVDLGATGAII